MTIPPGWTRVAVVALATAAVLVLGGRLLDPEDGTMDETTGAETAGEGWAGRWQKVEEDRCPWPYPELLIVRVGGVYEAPGGPEAGSRFHSGDWTTEEDGTVLVLQAANDAMVRHRVLEHTADAFTLEASGGCRVRYRRGA